MYASSLHMLLICKCSGILHASIKNPVVHVHIITPRACARGKVIGRVVVVVVVVVISTKIAISRDIAI